MNYGQYEKTGNAQINTWGKNVYVKVPVANSKGKFMGRKIIKELNSQKIKLKYNSNI